MNKKLSPAEELDQFINGFRITPLLAAIAEIDVAGKLIQGPKSSEQLAKECNVNSSVLFRVLRTLSSVGIFKLLNDNEFALTELAKPLLEEHPDTRHATAKMWGLESNWQSYGAVLNNLRTGQTAFESIFNCNSFEYYQNNMHSGSVFDSYMQERTKRDVSAIVRSYNFSTAKSIIDIAGGSGILLSKILQTNPHLTAELFEQASVIKQAQELFTKHNISEQVKLTTGDLFNDVPSAGHDLYLLKWIIHDWTDEQSVVILKNIRRSMCASARLLLIEQAIHEDNLESYRTDIAMLLVTGGQERTLEEYTNLLSQAGFEVTQLIGTGCAFDIIEARCVSTYIRDNEQPLPCSAVAVANRHYRARFFS